MQRKISVIVPVYNAEKWLNRCVDSILKQSYKEFELILVNDGSKDSSGEICDRYKEADGRVRVLHKENAGVSEARNTGIDLATGDYIMFIDSDDEILDGFFENALNKIENTDWYLSDFIEVVNGKRNVKENNRKTLSGKITVAELYCGSEHDLWSINLWSPGCKLFKTSLIKEYNIRFEKNLRMEEDVFFNVMYAERAETAYVDEKDYYLYHKDNENSLVGRFNPNKYEESVRIYNEWRRIIIEKGVSQEGIENFENFYFRKMMLVIVHFYKHKRPQKEKKEIIKKVINNEWVHKNCTYGKSFSSKLMRFLITKKMALLINIAFWIKVK